MTARRTGDDERDAAVTREAKGSVHEAIGKLIGDDAARDRGTAERRAAELTPPDQDAATTDDGPADGKSPRR
jgi:uncharacterized protein YjbJ (UPF0337 family)